MPSENAATKVHLDGTTVHWTAEDQISVFSANSSSYVNNQYTLSGGANTAEATFNGLFEGSAKVAAFYPYNANNSFDGTAISVTMPDSYSYSEGEINKAPLASLITAETQPIPFKNAGALLAVTVNNIPAGYNKAILTSTDRPIAGSTTVSFDGSGNPTLNTISSGELKTITISWTAELSISNKTFYFPLPVGEYSSLKVSITDGTTTKDLKTKELDAKRSVRYKTTITLDEVSGLIPTPASDVNAANSEFVNGATNVEITEIENNPAPITLPSTDDPVSLTLPETSKELTIKAPTSGTEPDVLNVYVPDGDIDNITFNVPNTTVYVNGTLVNVTAYTADNTLYLKKGSHITGELTVGKGNVRIEAGASVTQIARHSDNEDAITRIYYDGENAPEISNNDNRIIIISAIESDLIAKFNAGGNQSITLDKDVTITQPLVLNDSEATITFKLNGHSITNSTAYDYDDCGETECYVFEVKAGTLNIDGSEGSSVNANGASDYDMAVFANDSGKVNISGGKFTNTGKENDGCDLIYVRDNAAVTISGGEFEAGNMSSDVGNQYVALNIRDANRSTASIIVTGGKFHKFNPANNVSEGNLTNFTANNTMVAVSGTENDEVYEVIDLTDGYTLTSNVKIATPIVINTTNEIALNLGTYSLTNETAYDYDNCGETECYVFEVKDGTLNITGSEGSSVNANGASDYDMAVFANGSGIVNISGGKFTNTGKENDGCDLIYVRDNAAVTISGGEFEAGNMSSDVGNQYVALNIRDADRNTASIIVTGGKFHKFNPANNVSEGVCTNFVAAGYISTCIDNGETYVVQKES